MIQVISPFLSRVAELLLDVVCVVRDVHIDSCWLLLVLDLLVWLRKPRLLEVFLVLFYEVIEIFELDVALLPLPLPQSTQRLCKEWAGVRLPYYPSYLTTATSINYCATGVNVPPRE